jgi:glutathione S-transferase
MRGYRWADEPEAIAAMQRKVPDSVGACYAYIEELAFVGPFVRGETYTVADPYLFTVAQWMEADGVDPAQFPKVAAHREMMRRRKPVQDALRAEREGAGA